MGALICKPKGVSPLKQIVSYILNNYKMIKKLMVKNILFFSSFLYLQS